MFFILSIVAVYIVFSLTPGLVLNLIFHGGFPGGMKILLLLGFPRCFIYLLLEVPFYIFIGTGGYLIWRCIDFSINRGKKTYM
jgi:hypothetical protein